MTQSQWREAILRASREDGVAGRDGLTEFDRLMGSIKSLDAGDADWERALRAVIELLRHPEQTGRAGWLRLLGLLEELAPLPRNISERLAGVAESRTLEDQELHGYLIRILAFLGAPLHLSTLRRIGTAQELAAHHPLIWADILFNLDERSASADLLASLLAGGSHYKRGALQLLERWISRLTQRDAAQLFQTIRSRMASPDRRELNDWAVELGYSIWAGNTTAPTFAVMNNDVAALLDAVA